MRKLELFFETKNTDPEQIKSLHINLPGKKNKLWIKAKYFYLFGSRIGMIIHYD